MLVCSPTMVLFSYPPRPATSELCSPWQTWSWDCNCVCNSRGTGSLRILQRTLQQLELGTISMRSVAGEFVDRGGAVDAMWGGRGLVDGGRWR